mmetsp:Transcript_27078/g.42347  ORF Transcript_27078/g.42347 Transcript_27078/m.42347 type:complete len:286 (+) Transcript_27078:120-977(+)
MVVAEAAVMVEAMGVVAGVDHHQGMGTGSALAAEPTFLPPNGSVSSVAPPSLLGWAVVAEGVEVEVDSGNRLLGETATGSAPLAVPTASPPRWSASSVALPSRLVQAEAEAEGAIGDTEDHQEEGMAVEVGVAAMGAHPPGTETGSALNVEPTCLPPRASASSAAPQGLVEVGAEAPGAAATAAAATAAAAAAAERAKEVAEECRKLKRRPRGLKQCESWEWLHQNRRSSQSLLAPIQHTLQPLPEIRPVISRKMNWLMKWTRQRSLPPILTWVMRLAMMTWLHS